MIKKLLAITNPNEKVSLSSHDRLMLEMEKAWGKGISPYQFRKSLMSDLQFIFDMKKAKEKLAEERKHQMKAEEMKNKLIGGMRHG